jgi:hypothetical protein
MFEFFDGWSGKFEACFFGGHRDHLCRVERILPHYLIEAAGKPRQFRPIQLDSPKLSLRQGEFSSIQFIIDKVVIR